MKELERQEAIEYFENSWISEYQKRMYDRAIQALESQSEDAISRKEAMEFFKDDVYVVNELKNLHSVNPQPKRGHWIIKIKGSPREGGTLGEFTCSECGEKTYATAVKGNCKYCPNCGAKMTDKTLISDGDECFDKALMPLINEGYEPDIQINVREG